MKPHIKATVVNKWRYRDKAKDIADVVSAIESHTDSDIIVFPESCLVGFASKQDYESTIHVLQQLSTQHELLICIGLDEPSESPSPEKPCYNAAFLIDGQKIHKYRKMHLVWDEPDTTQPSDLGFPVFDTRLGKIGMLICYDNVLPESMRCLALQGADIICKVSAWPAAAEELWDLFTRARARENQVFVLAANDCSQQTYDDEGKGTAQIKFCGNSRVVDPMGQVLVNIAHDEQPFSCATVTLKAECLDSVQTMYGPNTNPLQSRRPEYYQRLSKP